MDKVLVDTNVLLRYLLDDIEEQSLVVEHILDGGAWTTTEVFAEITYVLESVYNVERKEIATALSIIVNRVDIEPYEVVLRAIEEYEKSNLDFVDCMMVAYDKMGISRVFTFDKGINKRLALE